MTFNGLTDIQAEAARKKYGSNGLNNNIKPQNLWTKILQRFSRISVKIYIIIQLLYWLAVLFQAIAQNSVPSSCWMVLIVQLLMLVPVVFNCVTELSYENKAIKHRRRFEESICKVYRCGNTVKDIPAGDIVKGDYVIIMQGNIVPADGMVVYGDITADSGRGNKLIRNFMDCSSNDNVTSDCVVHRGARVTSGYAVIKITSVELNEGVAANEKPQKAYGYNALIILFGIAGLAISAYTFVANWANLTVTDFALMLALNSTIIIAAEERLRNPAAFFILANMGNMYHDGIKSDRLKGKADMLFVDKSAFITDGKPVVTGFTDGDGKSYSKCYEIPYPIGTLLAKAIASNSQVLLNRGRIIGADPFECAEVSFISERIKSSLDLEVKETNINGTETSFDIKKFVKGKPNEIISQCKAFYDNSGEPKPFTSSVALVAMADELVFQSSNVVAFATEGYDGEFTFVGIITIHEKLRNGACAAFRAIRDNDTRIIMLTNEVTVKKSVSMTDKAVTGATSDEVISMEELLAMSDEDARRMLPALKIITGISDKEYLLSLSRGLKYKVGVTALSYDDIENAEGAYAIYASSLSCEAAKVSADVVLNDGLNSLLKYNIYSEKIDTNAAGYTACHMILLCAALVAAFFAQQILIPIIGLLIGVGNIIFCKAGSLSDKVQTQVQKYTQKYDI